MANFCAKHGCALEDGICPMCGEGENTHSKTSEITNPSSISNIIQSMKSRMGIGEPEDNEMDLYERGKKIVPECIETNANEIPVRQYDIAVLHTGLKFMHAEGKLQVTNQRLIFRAKGRSLIGRTTLQHHFALNEIGGVEARRDYRFGFFDLILGSLATSMVGSIFSGLCRISYINDPTGGVIFALIFGIGGVIPFFIVHKKFFIKLLCCGVSTGSLLAVKSNPIMGLLAFIAIIIQIAALLLFAFKPNLAFIIKTKGAAGAVEIRRKTRKEEYTGYEDVMPAKDTERAVREIGAMISDLQTLGDHGVKIWKKD